MALLIASLVFVCITLAIIVISSILGSGRQQVQDRLRGYIHPTADKPVQTVQRQIPAGGGWHKLLRNSAHYFEHANLAAYFERKLMKAGLPLRGSEFMVLLLGNSLFLFTVMLLLTRRLLLSVLFLLLGGMMPLLVLRIKEAQRKKKLNNQLADALILISNSLKTGYSFLQAVETVAKEMPPPIATEFSRTLREMNLGVPTEDALNNMVERADSADLELVVMSVLIQRQVGGNLAEVLDKIAATIRERVRIKGEIKTLTAQGRISGLIIGCLPLALGLLVYMINPEYIKILFIEPVGRMMLGGALVSLLIGVLLIRKIVNIQV